MCKFSRKGHVMVFSSRSNTLAYMVRFKVTGCRMAITSSPGQGQYLQCSPYSTTCSSPEYVISPVVSPIRDHTTSRVEYCSPEPRTTSPTYSPTASALRRTSSWSDIHLVVPKKIIKRKSNKFDRTIPTRYSARRRIPVVPYSP